MNLHDIRPAPGTVGICSLRDAAGTEFAALVDGAVVVAAHDLLGVDDAIPIGTILRTWATSWPALRDRLVDGQLPAKLARDDVESLTVLVPADRPQILQAGANYRKHVIDLIVAQRTGAAEGTTDEDLAEAAAKIMDDRRRNGVPYIFVGLHGALAGPFDEVRLPAYSEQPDWELELAVVISHGGRDIAAADALDHVAGYTIANDLTLRDLVYRPEMRAIGSDWMRAKNPPTFLPVGPIVVPAEYVADPQDLHLTLRLNGDVMQDEDTADMMFGLAELIAYASTRVELLPGDLLLTGSPAGNGAHYGRYLRHGDVMESTITGLGVQRNRCVAEGDRS